MTMEEIDGLSTPQERFAEKQYQRLQRDAELHGGMVGETALLELSEAVGILVKRNKRLGLVPNSRS